MTRVRCFRLTRALAAALLLGVVLTAPVRGDLLGLYRFENSTNPGADSSLAGNNLTAFGGWAIDPNGKYGHGLAFNGIDAVLGIAGPMGDVDDDALPTGFPLTHHSYTLAAWVNTPAVVNAGGAQMGIIGWGAYAAGSRVNALRLASDVAAFGAGIRHYWWGNDLDFTDTATTNLADGTYHHIAATYDDGTGIRSIYVDGNLVVSDTPARHHARTGDFRIGRTCNFCNEFFQGTMDDVAVFDESLSAGEIQKVMSGDFSDFGVP